LMSVNPKMDPKKYPRRQVAVHSARYKYIWYDDRPGEFYDLQEDPDEHENLVGRLDAESKVMLSRLQHAINEWQSNLEIFSPELVDDAEEMNDEVIQRLQALGYIA